MTTNDSLALSHLRVLDLGGPIGQFCARLLGDFGADVIKVEPPGGDPARFQGPYAGGTPDPERSLYFLNFNHNKRSVVLDLKTEEGRGHLRRLAQTCDVLVESFAPGHLEQMGLGYQTLSQANGSLIHTSITPYGQSGPYRDFLGTELTVQAMTSVNWIHGDDQAAPVLVPSEQLVQVAGLHAFYGILSAVHARRQTGRGQQVDVSMQDVGLWQLMMVLGDYTLNGTMRRRAGAAPSNPGVSIYRAKDGGMVQLAPYMDNHMKALLTWMEHPVVSEGPWLDPIFRRNNADILDVAIHEFVATMDRDAFVAEAQRRGVPATPLLRVSEFVHHPQPAARKWFQQLEHPVVGRYQAAGAPYRLSKTPWSVRKPAPRLGEHTGEVLAELEKEKPRAARSTGSLSRPLAGVRVMDFTQAVAGPVAAMLLGFMGAEVIKVETQGRPQPRRADQAGFPELNRNKLSATINAQTPKGHEMAMRLVARADVVIDNFRAGVMERMNLGYEQLSKVKPDIIVVQMPGMGREGPVKDYLCYGQQIFGLCGLGHIWGHPGSSLETRPKLGYTDYVAGAATAGAVALALEHKRRTGQGQFIEIAQLETLASTMGVNYLDYTVNGVDAEPRGNLSDRYAPQGVYPCRGWDAWCAISCRDDGEWLRLVKAMGEPGWALEERWSTVRGRLEGREELDRRIDEWTKGYTSRQVMYMLQRAGVPAGAVQNPEDLLHDPQLRARQAIATVRYDKPWGTLEHPALPAKLSETPGWSEGRAPAEGEHNDYVFREVLGLSPAEIEQLTVEGALR